jgi:hypothetical protein
VTTAAPTSVSFSAAPSPWDAPRLWELATFTLPDGGLVQLPGTAGEGKVVVSVTAKAKVKQKQASGSGTGQTTQKRAQKAETTVEAIEPCDIEIEVIWTRRIHAETEAALFLLNPNGPNGGVPVDIRHPETDANTVTAIMVTEFGPTKRDGGLYSKKIKATEWNPPPPAAPGDGAETPSQVGKWTASYGSGKSGGSVVQAGVPVGPPNSYSDTAKGVGGPNGPKAGP